MTEENTKIMSDADEYHVKNMWPYLRHVNTMTPEVAKEITDFCAECVKRGKDARKTAPVSDG